MDDAYLVRPDRAVGRPGLIRARGLSGEVLIKIWPRQKGSDDKDLEDIWRSELRQLHRLAAVPGAAEYFVPIRASGKDREGFYLVLDPGQGSPLSEYLDAARKPDLIARNRQSRARRTIWANARRLAEGLELLHSQGIIHRNLDPWAIFTALTPEPDFRITGFEWSMRIASLPGSKAKKLHDKIAEQPVSFARDWFNLALLIARLLDIPEGSLADLKVIPSEVAEHATAAEIRLLRIMLGADKIDRLDGDYVTAHIAAILDSIESEAAGKDARLCLSVRVGNDTRLGQAIRTASDRQIEIADQEQQLQFILNDLGDQPLLIRLKDNSHVLVGDRLNYRLSPYRQLRSTDEPSFEFAYCERADVDPPPSGAVSGRTTFARAALDIVPSRVAAETFPRRRGKVQPWDDLLARTLPRLARKTDLDRMHEALALLVVLEMAYAAADMFPVEIKGMAAASKPDTHSVVLIARADKDRSKLSDLLQLGAPAVRLAKLLDGDDAPAAGGWTLAEPSMLGEHSPTATTWRFMGSAEIDGLECFRFEGSAPVTQLGDAFLTPAGMTGRIAQFKRRLKALAALRQHTELLGMLADARGRISDSHDPLNESDDRFKALDRSKQDALREILATIPLFLLQGPPGVGKTFLAGDVVRRRFEEEPTSRMLLSAQSNSAIDHLMSEVEAIFRELPVEQRPLIVRARPVDDDDSVGEFEIDVQADNLLRSLAESPLVAEAPPRLRERVRNLAEARRTGMSPRIAPRDPIAQRTSSELRAFEGMILRAANLVFATTNSYAVERLIDERSLFDWSIVEEAGKATGGELLSPLLLSHRRLMIGDHKQLPPFDIDKISALLASGSLVNDAISLADSLISRYLKDPSVDDIFRELRAADNDLGPICATTLNVLRLFETLIEAELKRQKRQTQARPIARRLTEQYRMHPAIARIVSHCFYEDELVTNPDKERKFLSTPTPFESIDKERLPEAPIVFIDMPYCREEKPGARSGDRLPPWSNPGEADVVMTALRLLRAREGQRPSLAILSPYRQQVTALTSKLKNHIEGGSLDHLAGFAPAVAETGYCGTVDSFQGAEADLVVISLVRNNVHATPARALGFLRDDRRMNVLLSRAKWRLILVGSLSFYRHVVATSASLPDRDVGYLVKFFEALDKAAAGGEAAIVPLATLNGVRA